MWIERWDTIPGMKTTDSDWRYRINMELSRAAEARRDGNEGMARVCARRASGFALKEYFKRHEIRKPGLTPYRLIEIFRDLPAVPDEIKRIAIHLTLRVNPDSQLPVQADLIQDARALIAFLFPDEMSTEEEE